MNNKWIKWAKESSVICCGANYSDEDLASIPEDAATMRCGCGTPMSRADLWQGAVVLDIGCGIGIDVFLAASRVKPRGKIIGMDMTKEILDRAKRNALQGGYTNVEFLGSMAENLPLKDSSTDVVISNGVISLISNKLEVFQEIFRVLRPGGQMIISDIMCDKQAEAQNASHCHSTAEVPKEVYVGHIMEAGFRVNDIFFENEFESINGQRRYSLTIKAIKHEGFREMLSCLRNCAWV